MPKAKRPALEAVDWEALSPEGLWRLQRLALPVSLGVEYKEVAVALG